MPGVFAAIGAAIASVVSTVTAAIGAVTAALGSLGSALLGVVISVGLNLLAGALFKTPQPKPSDIQTIIRQSNAPRFRSYGRVKVGGVLVFASGGGEAVFGGAYLHRVFATGSGEIDAVEEHWISDTLVHPDANGNFNPHTGAPGSGYGHVEWRLGSDDQTALDGMLQSFPVSWSEDHRGRGIPCAYVRLRQVPQEDFTRVYPEGANTQYRQVQRGAKLFDPNNPAHDIADKSTWQWSENAARIILDYLIHPDGLNLPTHWITNTLDEWKQAVLDCEDLIPLKAGGSEMRYRIGNSYRFDERPADILSRFLTACDGVLTPSPKRGLVLKVGKWEAPTVTIDESAIVAFQDVGHGRDILTTANTIKAQFTSPKHDFRETDVEPWIDEADVAVRGEIIQDLELYAVPSFAQARRLMKLAARRANPAWTATLTTNLRGLPVLGERFIRVTYSDFGIDEEFEVLSTEMIIDEEARLTGLNIKVASLSADAYAWDAATEEGDPPPEPEKIIIDDDIPVPTGLNVVVGQRQTGSGPVAIAVLTWDPIDDPDIFHVEARGKKTTDSAWFAVGVSPEQNYAESGVLEDGKQYEFQIRQVASTNRAGDWSGSVTVTAVADTTPPAAVTGLLGFVDGADITISWTQPNDENVVGARVYRNAADDFATATLIDTVYGGPSLFLQATDPGTTGPWYYWVAAINGSQVEGPETATGLVS